MHMDLSIYNILGQKITTLVSEKHRAGQYQVEWDATGFPGGVYLYSLLTDNKFKFEKKDLHIFPGNKTGIWDLKKLAPPSGLTY